MSQYNFLDTRPDGEETGAKKRGKGPPNRMNDLPYREWMKFQKSFFRHQSDNLLIKECVEFFTKAVWPDGTPSRSLVLDFDDFDPKPLSHPRIIESKYGFNSVTELTADLERRATEETKFDFVFVNLQRHLTDVDALADFLKRTADNFFRSLRSLLVDDRYCCVAVATNAEGGTGFPIPWSVALASRHCLRLRDEKIGLIEKRGRLYYCLFMQAKDDERPRYLMTPHTIRIATAVHPIPGWVIPRPPPRRKNEILHPAKYPETLAEGYIELFTKSGAAILDPMVGTGSTVIAALRRKRNGFGVELSARFAQIAAQRVEFERAMGSDLFDTRQVTGSIVVGDATRLEKIPELAGKSFEYAITSPPYWSMLTNPGSENQEMRRKKSLPLKYSDDEADVGNVSDYDEFLDLLGAVYLGVAKKLVGGGVMTVVVKNVKRNHVLYPLAWDLTARLCGEAGHYDYLGNTFWCQDDVGLKPFAVGIHWVSNILHHYCLHFRKRP
jgi:hypothetical protein